MKKKFLAIVIMFLGLSCFAQTFSLYGGRDGKVFLGYLNANKYDANSIWNVYGTYGSKYNANSIWNKYGEYGLEYNQYSPWNPYTSSPPGIYDEYGNFYGYFTANKYLNNRATAKWILWIIDNYKSLQDNPEAGYKFLFE